MSGLPIHACEALPETRETGFVLQIQSFSVNDGEGVRTVIFLPGCPLRCRWCANPETWTQFPKLAVYHSRCMDCGACERACPQSLFPPRLENPAAAGCTACGLCAGVCPSGALKILVREMSVADVIRAVERDEVFFRASNGGVTFSGGEPTFQTGFLRALASAFDQRGIDICMETCGFFVWEEVSDIIEKCSHVLFDLKHMDPAAHRELTGVSNERILENCSRIAALGKALTIRTPTIRNLNDTRENLEATARFMKERLPGAAIELLPYHDLGREKYRAIGQTERLPDAYAAPDSQTMEQTEDFFRRQGIPVVRYR